MWRGILATLLLCGVSMAVIADEQECEALMDDVDEVLEGDEAATHIEADILEDVRMKREEAEHQLRDGDHDGCVETMNAAAEALGV